MDYPELQGGFTDNKINQDEAPSHPGIPNLQLINPKKKPHRKINSLP